MSIMPKMPECQAISITLRCFYKMPNSSNLASYCRTFQPCESSSAYWSIVDARVVVEGGGVKHEIAYISRTVDDIDPNSKGVCLFGTLGPYRVDIFQNMPKF